MMLQTMTDTKQPFATADARWDAFLRRDPAADGRFVTGVTSTGIYCRPTCSARKPRRENVRFSQSPAEAHTAGFGACKRCRPELAAPAGRTIAHVAEAL